MGHSDVRNTGKCVESLHEVVCIEVVKTESWDLDPVEEG